MSGRPATSMSGFGRSRVSSPMRVPRPAAKIITAAGVMRRPRCGRGPPGSGAGTWRGDEGGEGGEGGVGEVAR